MGCSPSGPGCSSITFPCGHRSCQQTYFYLSSGTFWSLLFHRHVYSFSHILSLLCSRIAMSFCPVSFFYPFFNMLSQRHYYCHWWAQGSALVSNSSMLDPAGTVFIRHRGSFWHLLREATHVVPLACYPSLARQTQYTHLSFLTCSFWTACTTAMGFISPTLSNHI